MAHTPDTVKAQIQADIAASNAKTGASDSTLHDAVNRLIGGFGVVSGITPTDRTKLTENGIFNVTNFAEAEVAVPASGITPSGSLSIKQNGTFNVFNYAEAVVDVPTPVGLNARVFTATVASDVTSGNYTIFGANEYIASIRSNANAFVMIRPLNCPKATAMYSFWMAANFIIFYSASTARKNILCRTTTSATNVTFNGGGLTSNSYGGHLNCNSDGSLLIRECNTTYPVKAGEYQIIAGVVEML